MPFFSHVFVFSVTALTDTARCRYTDPWLCLEAPQNYMQSRATR